MKKVCMLGEGAWGTAVSTLLAHNGIHVKLWCYDAAVAKAIKNNRVNERYLPGIQLDEKIQLFTDLESALENVDFIFEAIPVKFLRSIVEKTKPFYFQNTPWIILSKGIEQDTLLFPTQIIEDILGFVEKKAVLVGPSFAKDVAEKKITGITLAVSDCEFGVPLQKMLANDYFRPYLLLDLIGAQAGAALKNVITIGIGMLDGAGFTDNTKAFLFTRGLQEIVQLTTILGGKTETVYGLSGVGDLVLTSMGSLSKNLEVGKRFGKGQTLEQILQETGYIPEGINTVKSVQQIIKNRKLDLPVCQGIYNILFNEKTIAQVLDELMQRPLEQECLY